MGTCSNLDLKICKKKLLSHVMNLLHYQFAQSTVNQWKMSTFSLALNRALCSSSLSLTPASHFPSFDLSFYTLFFSFSSTCSSWRGTRPELPGLQHSETKEWIPGHRVRTAQFCNMKFLTFPTKLSEEGMKRHDFKENEVLGMWQIYLNYKENKSMVEERRQMWRNTWRDVH